MGQPYQQLWERLLAHHGERQAARVLSRLIAITETADEEAVKRALEQLLKTSSTPPAPKGKEKVEFPATLRRFTVEGSSVAVFDALLQEARDE